MIELDENGLIDGMTGDEYTQVRQLIKEINRSSWPRQLDGDNPVLKAAAKSFRAFNEAQRGCFLREYAPLGLPLDAILQILTAFGLASAVTD